MTAPAVIDTDGVLTDPQHPGWRAVVVPDAEADQPCDDLSAPPVLIDTRGHARLSGEVFQPRHGQRIEVAYEHLHDPQLFERYLRQQHGVTTVAAATRVDLSVLVFDTADYRAHSGITGTANLDGDQKQWQAWLDGDVYGVSLQRLTPARSCRTCAATEPAGWVTVESVWGCYGHTHAADVALGLLRETATALANLGEDHR